MSDPKALPWRLADCDARASEFPNTFALVPRSDRVGLAPGRFVKLIFEPNRLNTVGGGERMWVEITARDDAGYSGLVRNNPVMCGPTFNTEIHFEGRHICEVLDA